MNRTPDTERWVAALRSGDYLQTQGQLVSRIGGTKRYCCMGVLAEVTGAFETLPSLEFLATLPSEVRERHGMSQHEQQRLIELNDAWMVSFAGIADVIEEMFRETD